MNQRVMVGESDFERANRIVQRLHRMLQGIERARRNPNRREAYHLSVAIEHVYAGEFTESEQAIRSAERVDHVRREYQSIQERIVQAQAETLDERRRRHGTEDLMARLKHELNELQQASERRRWWHWR